MTLSNHLLSGIIISHLVPLPAAAPIAFISHFLLDSMPHFGFKNYTERAENTKLFKAINVCDGLIAFVIITALLLTQNYVPLFTALIAASPDFVWVYRYIFKEKFGSLPPAEMGIFTKFHKNIQWCERKWGFLVELPFAVFFMYLITAF